MLLLILVFPAQSWSEQLCFENIEAKKLLVEVKFGRNAIDRLNICQQQYSTSAQINKNDAILIKGLTEDKNILTKMSDDYKSKYIDVSKLQSECEKSKPKRLTWFLTGIASTLAAIVVIGFLTK
jgi:hypothetical protein